MNRLICRATLIALCLSAAAFAAPQAERPVEPKHPVRPHIVIQRGDNSEIERTFLGIATVPVPEEVRAHIDLAPGAGLMVMFVEPESPAAKAGLVKSDILVKLGDQLLVNHDQLSTLIHAAKAGDEISLDVIHAGKHATIKVTLTSKPVRRQEIFIRPERFPIRPEARPDHPDFDRPGFDPDEMPRQIDRIERQLRESGLNDEQIDRIMDRLRDQMHRMNELHADHPRPPHELDRERPRPEGDRPPGTQTHAKVSYNDDDHKLLMTIENGHKHLHAETHDGKQVFDGPVDTPEQREKIPAPIREKLERLENQTRIDIRIHPDPDRPENPDRPDRPEPRRDRPPL